MAVVRRVLALLLAGLLPACGPGADPAPSGAGDLRAFALAEASAAAEREDPMLALLLARAAVRLRETPETLCASARPSTRAGRGSASRAA